MPAIKTFLWCLVPDYTLESNFRLRKLDVGLVSAGSNGFEPKRLVFADRKVIICVVCFIEFVVCSMRNPVVYRAAKKEVFC